MWGFINCTRYYDAFGVTKVVLNEASLAVPTTDKLGLLVPAGEGKSTIIKLLAGIDEPDDGFVLRDPGGWPLGYAGAMRLDLTGEENIHNIALLVGLDAASYSAFCMEFSELGEAYFHPMTLYTGRQRAQLAFAASFGIPASTYLADEKIAVGNEAFKAKCTVALKARLQTCGLILVASNPRVTAGICDRHAVVRHGKIIACADHEEAKQIFESGTGDGVASEIVDEDLASFDIA